MFIIFIRYNHTFLRFFWKYLRRVNLERNLVHFTSIELDSQMSFGWLPSKVSHKRFHSTFYHTKHGIDATIQICISIRTNEYWDTRNQFLFVTQVSFTIFSLSQYKFWRVYGKTSIFWWFHFSLKWTSSRWLNMLEKGKWGRCPISSHKSSAQHLRWLICWSKELRALLLLAWSDLMWTKLGPPFSTFPVPADSFDLFSIFQSWGDCVQL